MNKTAIRIFSYFIITAAMVAMILLVINFLGFGILGSDIDKRNNKSPQYILDAVSKNLKVTDKHIYLKDADIIPENSWCILLNDNGDIIWEQNQPKDIPDHYSLNDVARMTRWFLNDYPVYVRTEDYGLLVFGSPKNAVGKYHIEYSMDWFDSLPERIAKIFILNLALATLLACLFGIHFYQSLNMLTSGITDLRKEKPVQLREKGIWKELAHNINETSNTIQRKNTALSIRDSARKNWIAGISHDIRTPLSIIMGYSEALENSQELSRENKKKAGIITSQSMKIKNLIGDLNLISSLEYDMQPSKKKPIRLCPLLRSIVTEIINNDLSEQYQIQLDLQYEKAIVLGDKALLERAFFNLIYNSIAHNPKGCKITITLHKNNNHVQILIADNGAGVPEQVLETITEIPKSAHGLGLPMAYKIIYVHGGTFHARNENGFVITIKLPLLQSPN